MNANGQLSIHFHIYFVHIINSSGSLAAPGHNRYTPKVDIITCMLAFGANPVYFNTEALTDSIAVLVVW